MSRPTWVPRLRLTRAIAKAEPSESKLKEARSTAKLAIHPSANAALVIEKFAIISGIWTWGSWQVT